MTSRSPERSCGIHRALAEALEPRTLFSGGGFLDPSFGAGGVAALTPPVPFNDLPIALAEQPDGQLLIGGGTDHSQFVERLNLNGTVDSTFGNGGSVMLPFSSGVNSVSLSVQPDGKIVIAAAGFQTLDFIRLNPNGTLDTSFAPDQPDHAAHAGPEQFAQFSGTQMAIEKDGRIIALTHDVAQLPSGEVSTSERLTEINPDGSINSADSNPSFDFSAPHLRLDSQGRFVAVRRLIAPSPVVQFVRFNEDGTMDPTFGNHSVTGTEASVFANPQDFIVTPDGGMMVAVTGFLQAVEELRLTPSGEPDASFDPGGERFILVNSFAAAGDEVFLPNGRLVFAGTRFDSGNPMPAVVRLKADGHQDSTFGDTGVSEPSLNSGSLMLENDGSIVSAGAGATPGSLFVTRYLGKTATLTPDGNLILTGTDSADTISVTSIGTGLEAVANGATQFVTRSLVHHLWISGHYGNDTITIGDGVLGATMQGDAGADSLVGGDANDSLSGGAGNDTIDGRGGDDTLRGGSGNDVLHGGAGNDRLFGGAGDDTLTGGPETDLLLGGTGNDLFFTIDGEADTMLGGSGNNTAHVDQGLDQIPNGDIQMVLNT